MLSLPALQIGTSRLHPFPPFLSTQSFAIVSPRTGHQLPDRRAVLRNLRQHLVGGAQGYSREKAERVILPKSGAGVELERGPVERLAVGVRPQQSQLGVAQSGVGSLAFFQLTVEFVH